MMRALPVLVAAAVAGPATAQAMDHAMHGMAPAPSTLAGAPSVATDRAADRYFDPAEMRAAMDHVYRETSTGTMSMLLFNLAEVQVRDGTNGYRWDVIGWTGGDIDRLVVKSEGAGDFGNAIDDAEVQLLWGHAITPYFNLETGVRYDFAPTPTRGYLTIGIEGMAAYWFAVEAAAFLSDQGEVSGRLKVDYDQRITQKWILQPRAEVNLSAQDVPDRGIGAGFNDIELGLRLRYEIVREFAPYVGISWTSNLGQTAQYARDAGEPVTTTNFVVGIRTWF